MKRRKIAIAAAVVISAVLLGAAIYASLPRTHAETDRLVANWRSTGNAFEVRGVVLDSKQKPVVGQTVHVVDDSGGLIVTTDEHGRFSARVGETEVRSVELHGIGSVRWGWLGFGGLDATKGVELDITVK